MADRSSTGMYEDAALGALLGTFVGDALGMAYEGQPAAAIPERIEMVEARRGRGTYTDDTEMMIALAESLAEHGRVAPEQLADRFLERCDPSRGYGAGTLAVMAAWRRGHGVDAAAREAFGGQGSFGNGAAMRVAPVAVRFAGDPARLVREARRSAEVTHAHPVGVDSATVQAVAVAAAARGKDFAAAARDAAGTDEIRGPLDCAAELLAGPGPEPAAVAATLGNSSAAHGSVPAAIYAAAREADFERAVSFAIRCGGDADTIGAMAGAIAGARDGAGAIPRRWRKALEDGAAGASLVVSLALRLARAAAGEGPPSSR